MKAPRRVVPPALGARFAETFDWAGWERVIEANGVELDRPYGSRHPRFPEIRYPLDYGFVRGTRAGDGDEVDVFVGRAAGLGLVGAILTTDHRRGDREAKLLYRCGPEEVYLAHGFLNFDRRLMEGVLVLRRPMGALWDAAEAPG